MALSDDLRKRVVEAVIVACKPAHIPCKFLYTHNHNFRCSGRRSLSCCIAGMLPHMV
jgi:hypothetical protein